MRCDVHTILIVVLSHLSFYLYMIAANHNYYIALHKRKMISYNLIFMLYVFICRLFITVSLQYHLKIDKLTSYAATK